jgi:hypothetical protein
MHKEADMFSFTWVTDVQDKISHSVRSYAVRQVLLPPDHNVTLYTNTVRFFNK